MIINANIRAYCNIILNILNYSRCGQGITYIKLTFRYFDRVRAQCSTRRSIRRRRIKRDFILSCRARYLLTQVNYHSKMTLILRVRFRCITRVLFIISGGCIGFFREDYFGLLYILDQCYFCFSMAGLFTTQD